MKIHKSAFVFSASALVLALSACGGSGSSAGSSGTGEVKSSVASVSAKTTTATKPVDATPKYLISVTGDGFPNKVGPLDIKSGGTGIPEVQASFGPPATRPPGNCGSGTPVGIATWPKVGMKISFENFGGANCQGAAQVITVSGPAATGVWALSKSGLKVGDTVASMRRLYPDLKRAAQGPGYALVSAGQTGPNPYDSIVAFTSAGKVTGFQVWAGQAGE